MRPIHSWVLIALLLSACQRPAPLPSASATPASVALPLRSRAAALLQKAEQARQAKDRETEALALREAVDVLGSRHPSPQLESTRALCIDAMVEAGGNAESHRLWKELEKKNGPSKEAGRMRERARKLMLQQAGELTVQVDLDLKAKRPQAALCSARASLLLCQQAGGDAKQIQLAKAAEKRAESNLGQH